MIFIKTNLSNSCISCSLKEGILFRLENCRRNSFPIKSSVKLLTAIMLTATLTFLCSKVMTDKTSLNTSLRSSNDSSVPVNRGMLLVVTTTATAAMEGVSFRDREQQTDFPDFNQQLAEEKRPKYRSLVEQLWATNKSQHTDTTLDDRSSAVSRKIAPLFVVRGKLIKKTPYLTELIYGGNTTTDRVKNDGIDNITANTENNRMGSRY